MKSSKINNFDLIRLAAATQVVVIHTSEHLKIDFQAIGTLILLFLRHFPGVPIFFTVSGFLIYWSFERNKDRIKQFYNNRLLRIYPALWVSFIVTIIILFFFKIIDFNILLTKDIITWSITQVSFMQFYTPDILRSFGVGTPNGSLWTICIELQFYLIVPLIFYLVEKPKARWKSNTTLISIAIISISYYCFVKELNRESMIVKLSGVFIIPYLYNFIIGIFIYKNWAILENILRGKALYWFSAYILYAFIFHWWQHLYFPQYWPNALGLLANIILSFTVISLAFSCTHLSEKVINGFDISYGIYIYHMLIVNCFVELGFINNATYLALVILFTYLLGVLSWTIVERKAIGLKNVFIGKATIK